MDTTFDNTNSNISISNALIEDISLSGDSLLLTVSYEDCVDCNRVEETLSIVVSDNTNIINESGQQVPSRTLRAGMTINAIVSAAMTRSIPPQTNAIQIQIISSPLMDNTTTGRIVEIDRPNRSFTIISGNNLSSVIRFNVPNNTPIFDRSGRPVNFQRLVPGMQVWVRHASFMTASIPPQTTAFEIRIQ